MMRRNEDDTITLSNRVVQFALGVAALLALVGSLGAKMYLVSGRVEHAVQDTSFIRHERDQLRKDSMQDAATDSVRADVVRALHVQLEFNCYVNGYPSGFCDSIPRKRERP